MTEAKSSETGETTMDSEHVIDLRQKEHPDRGITVFRNVWLYSWECSCGTKGPVWYSAIGSAERSGLRHLAHMLTEAR